MTVEKACDCRRESDRDFALRRLREIAEDGVTTHDQIEAAKALLAATTVRNPLSQQSSGISVWPSSQRYGNTC